MKKKVGIVNNEERNELQHWFERKNGLCELIKIIDINDYKIYDRIVSDLGEAQTQIQNWWDKLSLKYDWESADGGHWEIDFTTAEIFLIY